MSESGNKMLLSRTVKYDYDPHGEQRAAVYIHYPFSGPPVWNPRVARGTWVWERQGFNTWTVSLPEKQLKQLEAVPGVTFVKVALAH